MFSINGTSFDIRELEPGIGSFEIKTNVGYITLTSISKFDSFPKRDQFTILRFIKKYEADIVFANSTLYFPDTVFTKAFQIKFYEKELSNEERFDRLERELADLRSKFQTI